MRECQGGGEQPVYFVWGFWPKILQKKKNLLLQMLMGEEWYNVCRYGTVMREHSPRVSHVWILTPSNKANL